MVTPYLGLIEGLRGIIAVCRYTGNPVAKTQII
jgi:hypothetical protein